jgi:hypothetical protein
METLTQKAGMSRGFVAFRAAYVTAVFWCAAALIVAWYVWVPHKGRPGTYFAHDTLPIASELSFVLFFVGGFWSMLSRQARNSACVKWSVYVAFAVMVLARIFSVAGP